MNKIEEIVDLFRGAFDVKNFMLRTELPCFKCPNINICNVQPEKEPIYTPMPGDDNTSIMIIAEAPSGNGGTGPKVGGFFGDVKEHKSPLFILKRFIIDTFGEIPYFTDLIKCGVAKQRDKDVLNTREPHCIDMFLIKEIKIMKPRHIFCIGWRAQNALDKLQKKNLIDNTIRIVNLMHYSRQALLPLSPEDKRKIIWKMQADMLTKEDLEGMNLLSLSYFRNYFDRSNH